MAAADSTAVLRSGLNLMRRMPPKDVSTNLSGLTALRPDLTEEFLQRVDQPLQTRVCPASKRKFLLSDYNRDGDSYRSPWSGVYVPALDDGFAPNERLRGLEVQANEIFDSYRELYYEALSDSVSSVYFWELGSGTAFASCWLIKKEIGGGRYVKSGAWDSIHVVEVTPIPAAAGGKTGAATFKYKLTSTVLLSLVVDRAETGVGVVEMSGSLTRQATATHAVANDAGHVANCGALIEAQESDLRGALDALYISKTREIVSALRVRSDSVMAGAGGRGFVADLAAAVKKRDLATA